MIRNAEGVTRSHLIRGIEFVAGKSYRTLDHTRVVDVHEVRRMPRNVHAFVSVGDHPPVWVDVRYTGCEELIRLICAVNRWPNVVAACLELCKWPRSARVRRELSRALSHMQSFGEAAKC